jgi:prepilin-type N-terminal cleavage/methylation domain-containing protein
MYPPSQAQKGSMKMKHNVKENTQQGFTLVELAIVLVIIGLIIGGVLVGQDMIRSAEIRSTIGQYEKYNTALNVFRDKFGGIPGDVANPGRFGFTTTLATRRNNNGRLEDCATGRLLGCETALFWEDLSDASLIDTALAAGAALDDANHAAAGVVTGSLPGADIGNGNLWQVYEVNGQNMYQLSAVNIATAGPALPAVGSYGIKTIQAYNIDQKLDDGLPLSGIVSAVDGRGDPDSVVAGGTATSCINTTDYNIDTAAESDSPNCALMLRMN